MIRININISDGGEVNVTVEKEGSHEPVEPVKVITDKPTVKKMPKVKKEPKANGRAPRFNDEQTAEIIRRYQAGEGPKAIAVSLGCARSTINNLLSKAGVIEGRTGKHLAKLNKSRAKKQEPQPKAEETEPV